jgi:hypothetical protein
VLRRWARSGAGLARQGQLGASLAAAAVSLFCASHAFGRETITFSDEYACVLTGDVARCLPGVDAPGTAQTKLSRAHFDGSRALVVPLPPKVARVQLLGNALCFVFDGQGELQCFGDVAEAARGARFETVKADGRPVYVEELIVAAGRDPRGVVCSRPFCSQLEWGGRTLLTTMPSYLAQYHIGSRLNAGIRQGGQLVLWLHEAGENAHEILELPGIFGPNDRARHVSVWGDKACALFDDGTLRCFHYGRPGVRTFRPRLPVRELVVGGDAGCISVGGDGFSAGLNCFSMADDEPLLAREIPAFKDHLPDRLSMGRHHACVEDDHRLVCFRPLADATGPVVREHVNPDPRAPYRPPLPEGEPRWHVRFGLPFAIGSGRYWTKSETNKGMWLRFRGLALFDHGIVREAQPGDLAGGFYGEVGWYRVEPDLKLATGAGVAGGWWLTEGISLMPSVGWYRQDYSEGVAGQGIAAGLALGAVWYPDWAPLALQLGGHVEGRYGLGARRERSLLWAGQFDSSAVVLVPVALSLMLTGDWDFGS